MCNGSRGVGLQEILPGPILLVGLLVFVITSGLIILYRKRGITIVGGYIL